MKESLNRMLGAVSTLLLIGLFVVSVAPASAGGVGDRITALEEELSQLKAEQVQVREDALAAKAKLPSFKYRPRGGLTISAADKSWSIRFRYRFHVHMYNEFDGDDRRGRASGDLFFRRSRPTVAYCWENCLYTFTFSLDADTGNQIELQTTSLAINLQKLNPNFPTLFIHDKGGQSAWYVLRSSNSSAFTEENEDLLADSNIDIFSHRGIAVGWMAKKLGNGDATFYVEYVPCAGCNKNVVSDTDRGQLFLKAGARPWRKGKNKWLKKIKFGMVWKTDSVDTRSARGNERLRLRTYTRRPARIAVFDTNTAGRIGDGQHHFISYGAEWGAGPYLLRVAGQTSKWASEDDVRKKVIPGVGVNLGGVSGRHWGIGNELFIWSPKGAFTGSSSKAGSVLVGYQFGRADASCGKGADCVPGASTSSGNHLRSHDFSIWYFVTAGMSVGTWWTQFSTPNMPTGDQVEIGCSSNTNTTVGKDCDWWTWNLGLRADF
jgi:hypothetical protein